MEIIKFEVGIANGKFFIHILEQADWTRSNGTGVKTFKASNGYRVVSDLNPYFIDNTIYIKGRNTNCDDEVLSIECQEELYDITRSLEEWADAMKNNKKARAAWGYKELSPKVEPKPSTSTIVYEF